MEFMQRKGSLSKIQSLTTKNSGQVHVEIETLRLLIRSFKSEDLEHMMSIYGDSNLTRLFDYGKAWSKNEVLEFLKEKGTIYFEHGKPFGLFTIQLKNENCSIGYIDLLPTEDPSILEIGYILNSQYHNKGYCSEAFNALLFDYIDEINDLGNYKIEEVIATVHPDNIASKRVLEKAGMNFEKFITRFGNPRLKYHLKRKLI